MTGNIWLAYVHNNEGRLMGAGEVSKEASDFAAALFARQGLHENLIPGVPVDVVWSATGTAMLLTIRHKDGRVLTEVAAARDMSTSAEMWHELVSANPKATEDYRAKPPSPPWIGVSHLGYRRSETELINLSTALAKIVGQAWIGKR